ncbi:hypothetical protein Bsp3421_005044 [Burkholderia sp. FERM BP-3421]|uniref:hypothetical protein n=1 Tax=Burkholderia sp. FERM BP-3421 TaxID=1494466 RepID=UPI00235EB68C|nr:hypothetical protein [Burkholderia sp. FERM BP-3421]WDD94897.1 hypothetical protein Bsp3421_005044 [Burkholderia sp. FERM BP-3421]
MRRTRRPGSPGRDAGPGSPPPPSGPASSAPAEPSDAPADGDHNQGGARPEGLDYQRDLGTEQDA